MTCIALLTRFSSPPRAPCVLWVILYPPLPGKIYLTLAHPPAPPTQHANAKNKTQVDITLGILIASLTFFRFENGWRASLNGANASMHHLHHHHTPGSAKGAYGPRAEKKNAPWVV